MKKCYLSISMCCLAFINIFAQTPCSTLTVTVNSASICAGAAATLTASGAASYVWSGGFAGSSLTVSPGPAGTIPYTVTGTTAGCSSSAVGTVTINPVPDSPFTVNPVPTSIFAGTPVCVGTVSTITYTGNAPANATYTWGFSGGTVISGSGQGPYSVSWPTSGTPNVTLSVSWGTCTSSLTTVPVAVNLFPIITINSATICAGGSATLTASGATTYAWSNGAVGNSITVSPNITTSYTVTGTDAAFYSISYGCTAAALGIVTVYPKPTANFSFSPNPTSVGNPTITFTNQSSFDVNYWFWDFGDGNTLVNTPSPVHTYPSLDATYTVTLIIHNAGFCYDTVSHCVFVGLGSGPCIPTAVSQLEENNNTFSVYPNPTNGLFNIESTNPKGSNVQINIYNILGEYIYQHISTSTNQQIDLSAQPNGIYCISIKTNEGIVNKKIVVSH